VFIVDLSVMNILCLIEVVHEVGCPLEYAGLCGVSIAVVHPYLLTVNVVEGDGEIEV
jgi:hypothetical protein